MLKIVAIVAGLVLGAAVISAPQIIFKRVTDQPVVASLSAPADIIFKRVIECPANLRCTDLTV